LSSFIIIDMVKHKKTYVVKKLIKSKFKENNLIISSKRLDDFDKLVETQVLNMIQEELKQKKENIETQLNKNGN